MRELEPSLGRFAFLTRWHSLHLPCRSWIGPFISPDSNHSSRNSTSKKTVSAALSHEHGGLASFSLRDRQAALHWLIRSGRFGWQTRTFVTAEPSRPPAKPLRRFPGLWGKGKYKLYFTPMLIMYRTLLCLPYPTDSIHSTLLPPYHAHGELIGERSYQRKC